MPELPTVRAYTDDEKAEREVWRRRAAMENKVRKLLDGRSADPARASRYDLLADALMNVVVDQVFAAIHSPDFAASLAERGYAVAMLPDAGSPPPADDWAQDAADLYGWAGEPTGAVGMIDDLWQRAWLAGYAAAESQRHEQEEGRS